MTRGRVTVVAFMSRFCGPAIDALPALQRTAVRLEKEGISTITIIDETETSPALNDFLAAHHFTLPALLDAKHEATHEFNQWGTPYFYVLDAQGRIVFDATSSIETLLLRAEAVRLADSSHVS